MLKRLRALAALALLVLGAMLVISDGASPFLRTNEQTKVAPTGPPILNRTACSSA
jgi:hypothetical protein